jgi:3-oxoacyl-(acyl-carrier-protein) synthase
VVQGSARQADVRVALSTASGFGGTNAAVVLTRA